MRSEKRLEELRSLNFFLVRIFEMLRNRKTHASASKSPHHRARVALRESKLAQQALRIFNSFMLCFVVLSLAMPLEALAQDVKDAAGRKPSRQVVNSLPQKMNPTQRGQLASPSSRSQSSGVVAGQNLVKSEIEIARQGEQQSEQSVVIRVSTPRSSIYVDSKFHGAQEARVQVTDRAQVVEVVSPGHVPYRRIVPAKPVFDAELKQSGTTYAQWNVVLKSIDFLAESAAARDLRSGSLGAEGLRQGQRSPGSIDADVLLSAILDLRKQIQVLQAATEKSEKRVEMLSAQVQATNQNVAEKITGLKISTEELMKRAESDRQQAQRTREETLVGVKVIQEILNQTQVEYAKLRTDLNDVNTRVQGMREFAGKLADEKRRQEQMNAETLAAVKQVESLVGSSNRGLEDLKSGVRGVKEKVEELKNKASSPVVIVSPQPVSEPVGNAIDRAIATLPVPESKEDFQLDGEAPRIKGKFIQILSGDLDRPWTSGNEKAASVTFMRPDSPFRASDIQVCAAFTNNKNLMQRILVIPRKNIQEDLGMLRKHFPQSLIVTNPVCRPMRPTVKPQ